MSELGSRQPRWDLLLRPHRRHPVDREHLPPVRRRIDHDRRKLLRRRRTKFRSRVRRRLDDGLRRDGVDRKRLALLSRQRRLREEARS